MRRLSVLVKLTKRGTTSCSTSWVAFRSMSDRESSGLESIDTWAEWLALSLCSAAVPRGVKSPMVASTSSSSLILASVNQVNECHLKVFYNP